MTSYVYDFADGNKDLKDLLGGKGANLAEMTNLGLPVPPGFTITTEACQAYLAAGRRARRAGRGGRRAPRRARGRRWAARSATRDDPLLVSVRSGAKFSMPGMMETVLNIGLNDESRARAWRRRPATSGSPGTPTAGCVQMFGKTVLDIDGELLRGRPRRGQGRQGRHRRPRPRRRRPARAGRDVQGRSSRSRPAARSRRTRASSCDLAVRAVFDSWNADRAILYRRQERIPERPRHRRQRAGRWSSATAARPPAPASPSPATRRPARTGVYGDYLQNAQGEDVVAGIRNTVSPGRPRDHRQDVATTSCSTSWRGSRATTATCATSSSPSSSGKLWMLQTRVGKRTAEAAFRIAVAPGRRGPDRPRTRRCCGSPATSSPS